jgi:hypothetical protein
MQLREANSSSSVEHLKRKLVGFRGGDFSWRVAIEAGQPTELQSVAKLAPESQREAGSFVPAKGDMR